MHGRLKSLGRRYICANLQGCLYYQQGEFQQMPDALLSKTKGSVNAGGMVGADTG